MKDDRTLLAHMLEAIERIERFVGGMSQHEFDANELAQSAVVREFIVIGEAATYISDELRQRHPDLPLYEARGMRNHIVHQYWDINREQLWNTIKNELPSLKEALEKIVRN